MRVTAHLSDGAELDIADMDDASALDLREDLENGESRTMTFEMDGATIVVTRSHLVRVDFETGES